MLSAQMIAKAWMDESYRLKLAAQGLDVPPKPDDLEDEQLDLLNQDLLAPDQETGKNAAHGQSCC